VSGNADAPAARKIRPGCTEAGAREIIKRISMADTLTFVCSICNEPSSDICVYCTKDTCNNHLCEKCKRCSDCCQCDFRRKDD